MALEYYSFCMAKKFCSYLLYEKSQEFMDKRDKLYERVYPSETNTDQSLKVFSVCL